MAGRAHNRSLGGCGDFCNGKQVKNILFQLK